MLHRFSLWLRRCWNKLPMQLSLLGWPPLLSHGLAFILGTLLVRSSGQVIAIPTGKIMIPLSRMHRVAVDGKPLQPQQKLKILNRRGELWCRTVEDELGLWRAPGKNGETYVLWPTALVWASRLEDALQKKLALTTDSEKFGFCGGKSSVQAHPSPSGITYD